MNNNSFSDKLDLKIQGFLSKNPSPIEIIDFIKSEAHQIVFEKKQKNHSGGSKK